MSIFKYKAKKGPEELIEDKIEAKDQAEAIEKISHMGYIPIKVEEKKSYDELHKAAGSKAVSGKVKPRNITIFSRQLASLLKSGVPILDALNIISEQSENEYLKHVLYNIRDDVKGGMSFSAALESYPKIFPSIYISIIRTGENSGKFHEALLRISDYRTKQEEMLSRFRMAMAYPLLMAFVGIATVIFMLTFVMPRLMNIFMNMGQELPLVTTILINISLFLRAYWFWIAIILGAVILVARREAKTKAGRMSLSIFKLHLPIYGGFTLKVELGRFCRTMELLIKSGVPILKSIELAVPVLQNDLIKDQLIKSSAELEQGGSFGKTLKSSKLIPVFMSNLVIIGEESGRLHEALEEIANSYERDTEEAMRVMASLLEPIMILTVGLIVGFIVIAMLLPIFEINVMAR
ncbi:MAG: type II secretion system F family protein [Candidatus Omnitrophota bacterium]